MTELYGIANCATVKKARAWLEQNGMDYTFHDFKKAAPQPEMLHAWLQQIPLDTLINKRGTTWRKLTPEEQAMAAQPETAVTLMTQYPGIIKRPVLVHGAHVFIGFTPEHYAALFQAA